MSNYSTMNIKQEESEMDNDWIPRKKQRMNDDSRRREWHKNININEEMQNDFIQDQDPPLVLSPQHQFPIYSRVVIQNLQVRPQLNNHLAIIEEYLHDEGRYKVRPISRKARRLVRTKCVSIRPTNLRLVPPSSFKADLVDRIGQQFENIPLECEVILDEEGDQLVCKVKYGAFLGAEIQNKMKQELNMTVSCNKDPQILDIVNTKIDYDEWLAPGQVVDEDDVLILYHKAITKQLFDAMLDYELLRELDTTIHVGLMGEMNLCRLNFPFYIPGVTGLQPQNKKEE